MSLTILSSVFGLDLTCVGENVCFRLTQTLAHVVWQGTVIAVVFAILDFAFRRRAANVRYVLGVVSLSVMAICPLITYCCLSSPSQPSGVVRNSAFEVTSTETPVDGILDERSWQPQDSRAGLADARFQTPVGALQKTWMQAISPCAVVMYLSGVLAMLGRLAIGIRFGQRLRLASVVAVDERICRCVSAISDRWAIRIVPVVAYCQQVTVPVVVGVFRPMILLPPSLMTGLTVEQLEAMLIHELAHIRRWDLAINLAQRVVEALLFAHPAVWYVSHRISIERENACDDLVLALGWQSADYVAALLSLADICASKPLLGMNTASILAASGKSPSQLKQRVLRLLGESTASAPLLTRSGFGGVVVTVFMVLVASMVLSFHPDANGQSSKQLCVGTNMDAGFTVGEELKGRNDGNPPKVAAHLDQIAVEEADFGQSIADESEKAPQVKRSEAGDSENASPSRPDDPLFDVVIEGNQAIIDSEIAKHIKTRPGRPASQKQIKDDVDALVRTRWFASVEPTLRKTDEGMVLVFRVLERPIVRRVEYKGLRKMKQKVFDSLTQMKPGSPFDISWNRECARRIEDYYHEKGFAYAAVELEKGNDREDREVVFVIQEGPKVSITSVKFDDSRGFVDGILVTKTGTKTRILWMFGGIYDPTAVQDGIRGIKLYYRNLGYFDVAISEHLKPSDDGLNKVIHYEVIEGARYRIRNVAFSGDQIGDESELRALIKATADRFFDAREIRKDVEIIKAACCGSGRLYCRFDFESHLVPGESLVDIEFHIDAGNVYETRGSGVRVLEGFDGVRQMSKKRQETIEAIRRSKARIVE